MAAELGIYLLNGETTQLSPEHAQRLGATPVVVPVTGRTPVTVDAYHNDESAEPADRVDTKARTPANKSRRPRLRRPGA